MTITEYQEVRRRTEMLVRPLSEADCTVQSMPDASPAKWHLAHTSWFFETFVLAGVAGYQAFDPSFSYLFNSYYEAVGPRHCRSRRGLLTRPSLAEVCSYRAHVDRGMEQGLRAGLAGPQTAVVELGLHHEQQHQELILTDIKHALFQNPLAPIYVDREEGAPAVDPVPLHWVAQPEGVAWMGHDGNSFAFDNEGPRHRFYLQPFRLASRLTTNAEYLSFIEDGGYQRAELWLSDGWSAVQENGWNAPLYWVDRDGEWFNFTLSGLRELVASEPVCHISFYEADAFARWAGARLPTEQEWEIAAASEQARGCFADDGRFHPRAAAVDAAVCTQMFGDVWEWTRSAYSPYPGYRAAGGALGEYNGKFMCNQMVLRGGSCATPASHIRATYRNFFSPSTRWQFSGLRLACDA